MEQKKIEFVADNDQSLSRISPLQTYATDTVNYIVAHFDLADHWKEYDEIYAVWWFSEKDSEGSLIDENGDTVIPERMLDNKGTLRVNLCANSSENNVLTARLTSFSVEALKLVETNV